MMDHVDALIDAYIDHSIDDEQFAALSDWLREDAANRKTFARKLVLHSEIAEWCIERSGESMAGNMDAAEDIAELPTIQTTASDKLTKQKYAAALSYVLRHTFTPKRVALLASAAVLLLGVVLAIVILSGPGEDEPIAELPDVLWPGDEVPVTQRVVATLTAERDAVWDSASAEGALAPGSALRAGDRLTLTAGFAEITTKRGAVAILEAPATIELFDNNNAIRLHTGKLVGICDTASSKGFIVMTPTSQVLDIGTAFGVEVDETSSTTIQVYKGVVQVAPVVSGKPSGHSTNVYEQQAVLARPDTNLTAVAFDQDRFRYEQTELVQPAKIALGDALLIDFGWAGRGFETRKGNYNNLAGETGEVIVTVGAPPRTLLSDLIRAEDGRSTGVSFSVQSLSGNPGEEIAFGVRSNTDTNRSIAGFPATVMRDTIFLGNSFDPEVQTTTVLRFAGLDDGLTYDLTLASFIDDPNPRPESIFSAAGHRDSYAPKLGGVAELKGLKTDGRGNLEILWTLSDETIGAGQLDGLRLEAVGLE